MRKLLIVDDELRIRNVIKEYAEHNNYQVFEASDGYQALELLEEVKVDLIILDIMMPELDGFSTLKRIRKKFDTPVIMLSARNEEYDKLYSFELGIDDYVTKPFSLKELMARVNAVLDRSMKAINQVYKYKGLLVDFDAHKIIIDEKEVHVTPKEFEVLELLIKNENKIISRERFMDELWGFEYYGDDRTIDTHIKMLRQNLGDYRECIKTVRGIGYRFEKEDKGS